MRETTFPKKKWGQNFLQDKNIARKIVAALQAAPGTPVIEIGPGAGALTEFLLQTGAPYCGVEIDSRLAEGLRQRFSGCPNFTLVEADFLEWDLAAALRERPQTPGRVVGNIPYNITSPILFKLFDHADDLETAVLMVQKEVAERLIAPPAGKEYGLLAVNGQLFAEIKLLFRVPAARFFPRPRVDSAVIKLDFKKGVRAQFPDFQLFKTVLRHCFQHRRKMLRKSLSMLFPAAFVTTLDFDLTRRPEQLSIPEWKALTELIHLHLSREPQRGKPGIY